MQSNSTLSSQYVKEKNARYNMSIYQFTVNNYKHEPVQLETYQGKVLLIVNTAPKCGLVGQYEGIETLHDTYHEQGFDVLDFPCNQFMNQAPQSDEDIQSFCQINYQTTFETFAKIKVNGPESHALYQYLRKVKPKDMNAQGKIKGGLSTFLGNDIKWNFTKFLVNKKGEVVYRFSPTVQPEALIPFIETLLKKN